MKSSKIIGFILLLALPLLSLSQIVISEVCPKNASIIQDEDGDDPDWIELYNSSDNPVSLHGFSLKDADNNRWYFPETEINGHHYLLVFASGKNKTSGGLHTSFRLSYQGDAVYLLDQADQVMDKLEFGPIRPDQSCGRLSLTANGETVIFATPTPAGPNTIASAKTGYAAEPVFSLAPGFYQEPQTLIIQYDTTATSVYYSTDGSFPDSSSIRYVGPLILDSCIVIKAISIPKDNQFLCSRIVTCSYFIHFSTTLPVFSISTDPYNLWDWNHGIYVLGPNASTVYPYFGANFWQDWEVPTHVEFFETNKERILDQDAGLSINGGSVSRTRPMQSLRLTAREKFGESRFRYPFFEQKPLDHFKNIVLRNSSGDYNKTHFRDGSLHKLMIGNVDIDLLCYRPAVVFINGRYWGIQNIREKFSKFYLHENHDVDPDNLDILEEDSTVIQGDYTAFNAMYDFITHSDLTDNLIYDSVCNLLDIRSLSDYFIAETFLSNIDWPYNNIKYWRERIPGSKWRYLLMDLDISLGNYGWAPASMDILGRMLGPYGDKNRHVHILRKLLANNTFREYFINRYADLVNTLFTSDHLSSHIQSVVNILEPEMPRHFSRWGSSMENWYHEIDSVVYPYIEERPEVALQNIQDQFGLNKQVQLHLQSWPPNACSIHINTISPELPWEGTYFDGVPVTLTVIPKPGFLFSGWLSDHIVLATPSSPSITFNPDSSDRLIAYFGPLPEEKALSVFPNPANQSMTLYFDSEQAAPGRVILYDLTGQVVLEKENINISNGLNHLDLPVSLLASGMYIIQLTEAKEIRSARIIIAH